MSIGAIGFTAQSFFSAFSGARRVAAAGTAVESRSHPGPIVASSPQQPIPVAEGAPAQGPAAEHLLNAQPEVIYSVADGPASPTIETCRKSVIG